MRTSHPVKRKYRFDWHDNNRFELLIDGNHFMPRMLDAIRGAQNYILFEMYLIESGVVATRFIDALLAARARGVAVYVLIDAYGSLGLSQSDRERLRGGTQLALYNPLNLRRLRRNLFRNHRKLLTVDGNVAFTGGTGITDDFDPTVKPDSHWHEVMLEIRGPNVRDWEDLFASTWQRWNDAPVQLPERAAPAPAGDQAGRVTSSRSPVQSEIIRSLLKQARTAEQRVWLSTAYFAPSRKLRRALRRAAKRGVDVRLLLPGPLTDHAWIRSIGCRYYTQLLRSGVRIFEYQPHFLHAKTMLCDQWLSIGSSNADRWNMHWNLDANQEIRGSEIVQRVQDLFERDFGRSHEFSYQEWRCRPVHRKLREWFWGHVARLLTWFSLMKK